MAGTTGGQGGGREKDLVIAKVGSSLSWINVSQWVVLRTRRLEEHTDEMAAS